MSAKLLLIAVVLVAIVSSPAAVSAMHWGVASSGFQHEGYFPDSNWVRFVKANKSITHEYKNTVDFLHRYKSDIALAKALGVNTYRFSVEWARTEPQEGVVDQNAFLFYDDLINTVISSGMTPMITIDHWVYPGWLLDQGAWDKFETVDKWIKHATRVVTRYKGRGALWITINEPTEYQVRDSQYRGTNVLQQALMIANLISAHRRAYDLIHQLDPGALVSSNLAYQPPPLQQIRDAQFFDRVTDKIDFIALDYYYGLSLDNWSVAQALNGNIWDIKSQPDGLYYAMMTYHKKVPNLPFYIVENGMPTNNGYRSDGYTRSSHLLDHIYWMQRAVADGCTVIGYNYWSITDNYEWGTYQPRFGLYKVDVLTDPTLTRQPTDAVETYKQIIASNGVPANYVPVMPPSLCNLAADIQVCIGQIGSLLFPTKTPTAVGATKAPTQWWEGIFKHSESESEALAPGQISGIAIGAIAGAGLLGMAALTIVIRRRRSRERLSVDTSRDSAVLVAPVSSENPIFQGTPV